MTNGLTYELIKNAVEGDAVSIYKIVDIYEAYINALASEKLYDAHGNEYIGINVDLKDYLTSKLIQVIHTYQIA